MKKILVTGGLGFIGSHTVVELQNEGFEVVIIDDLSNTSIGVLEKITEITGIKPDFHQIDLRIKSEVKNLLPSGVSVIDSPSIVAEALKSVLTEMEEMESVSNQLEGHHFQVSDLTENFKFSARHFFGDDLTLEEVVL